MSGTSFSGEQLQLSLDIQEPGQKVSAFTNDEELLPKQLGQPNPDIATAQARDQINNRPHWLNLGGVLTASILLFIAVLSAGTRTTSTSTVEKFVGVELSPISPIERNLPVMKPAERSALLQIGLFRHLKGAESKQSEITDLGLSPGILKKVTVDGIMYTLVISPRDETEHKLALETLQANNINYFQTGKNGS